MDFNNSKTTSTPSSDAALDAPMFAPIPSWERGKKKKGLLGRKSGDAPAAAPIASRGHDSILDAPMNAPSRATTGTRAMDAPLHEPAAADLAMAGVTVDPVTTTRPMSQSQAFTPRETVVSSEPVMTAPAPRTAKTHRKNSVPAVAIAAGVVALGGLAAAGWYASQPRNDVASLTPGAPGEAVLAPGASSASTEIAAAPAAPAVTQTTTTVTPSAPAVRRTTTTTTRTAAVRTRPAPAAAASAAGVDASATLPAGPLPYSATVGATGDTSATSPATVNPAPAWNIPAAPPPVEPAPPTSATTETPATPATPAPEPQTAPDATTQP